MQAQALHGSVQERSSHVADAQREGCILPAALRHPSGNPNLLPVAMYKLLPRQERLEQDAIVAEVHLPKPVGPNDAPYIYSLEEGGNFLWSSENTELTTATSEDRGFSRYNVIGRFREVWSDKDNKRYFAIHFDEASSTAVRYTRIPSCRNYDRDHLRNQADVAAAATAHLVEWAGSSEDPSGSNNSAKRRRIE